MSQGEDRKSDKLKTSQKTFNRNLRRKVAHSEYQKRREQFLKEEREEGWDYRVKSGNKVEQRAAKIIREIREYERRVLFGNMASEVMPAPQTRDMGGQFLTNKELINNDSKLFKIASEVPKGALLHLHFNAELDPKLLLEKARETKNLYIRSTQPLLTPEDLRQTEMVFDVLDPSKVEPGFSIFSQNYPGGMQNWKEDEWKWKVWMRWEDFKKEYEKKFSEQHESKIMKKKTLDCSEPGDVRLCPAEEWLEKKMVLSEREVYKRRQTVNGVWARFNQATRCFKGLVNYESAYKWYIREAIDRMIEEKIIYAELRPMLLDEFIPADSGVDNDKIDRTRQMQLIINVIEEKQAELQKNDELKKFPFGLKIIYCTPRSIGKERMKAEMRACIDLKIKYPGLICGFDLVGAEDRKNHIGYYIEELLAFRKTCEEMKLDIPFMFHAGETLLDTGGSEDPENSNLYDAVLLNSRRIGHGFALMKHPKLVELCKRTKESPGICIELCPISNELLHLCRNIKEHPFPQLLAAGIPCTVNSDNPNLFSNSMSHEFYQIMVGAPTMSLYSWKQLALWSIEYSCLTEQDKTEGKDIFEENWKAFCKNVVKQYESLFEGDEIKSEMTRKDYVEFGKNNNIVE
ncbi:Cat eye syndrome critical region protein 1 [Pyrenophora tritici-repentis]|nr:Cat eye syndrome critical region protein 1 [Pyrenophora tritici-repentis]